MIGADQRTGKLLGGTDYLRQRIANAISTPLWTTVMHRGRGGALHELLDTAITHVDGGLIGAGEVRAPLGCFAEALKAFGETYAG